MMRFSIVIPVYNSSNTLQILMEEINETMQQFEGNFEVIFVNDCSIDNSWEVLKAIKKKYPFIRCFNLANNVGQWMATLAGISKTKGDSIITIDDDLEYDTKDILTLIEAYQQSNSLIVYGIPTEKKNKNLSYKLFFKIRDKFLRVFFNKIQTESLKIFNRKVYLNKHDEMYSFLHFEAYTKLTVANKFIQQKEVNYRKRYFGNSNHTLFMKTKLLLKYGIEYFKSPFKYLLYLLLIFSFVAIACKYIYLPIWAQIISEIGLITCMLIIFGIVGKYLTSLYFKLKGLPEFLIIDEY